jgi:hypothetical protein
VRLNNFSLSIKTLSWQQIESDQQGNRGRHATRVTGCVCEKHRQKGSRTNLFKIYTLEKSKKKRGLLLLSQKLTKVNNRPLGENSTNPVALLATLLHAKEAKMPR